MSERIFYNLGGIIVRVTADRNILRSAPFSNFQIRSDAWDISLEYRGCATLPRIEDTPVYEDRLTRVFRNKKGIHVCRKMPGNGEVKFCMSTDNNRDYICLVRENRPFLEEKELFFSMLPEYLLAPKGRVILHSSFIESEGGGIVFSAPSGTGKSTQAELWRKYISQTEIINGDRSILACENGHVHAYGLPLCGSSGIALNKHCILRAAVILRQGAENRVRRIKRRDAFAKLLSECTVTVWDQERMSIVADVLKEIVETVPVYYFSCTPNRSAVGVLREAICREENRNAHRK